MYLGLICETLSSTGKSVCVSGCLTFAVLSDGIFSQQLLQVSSKILERQGFSTWKRHDGLSGYIQLIGLLKYNKRIHNEYMGI